jgi:glutamine cyclotransferase
MMSLSRLICALLVCNVSLIVSLLAKDDFTLIRHLPHDRSSFTQGLVNYNGMLYESAGLYGRSSLRIINPDSWQVHKQVKVDPQYFAEGISIINDRVHMLTYHEKTMLVFDVMTLELLHKVKYETVTGEGWGLTNDGKYLIASDGSHILTVFEVPKENSKELVAIRYIQIRDSKTGKTVNNINELEYVDGYIYANVWFQDYIIKINYTSGMVEDQYDLKSLYPPHKRAPRVDCFNGIAFNHTDGSFLVTGKLWPRYYSLLIKGVGGHEETRELRV